MASTPAPVSLTITLPADVAAVLYEAAAGRGWTPESLAVDCIAQQTEIAVRHRVLLQRIEQVDGALIEIATALGAIEAAGGGGIDLADFCRYRKVG